MIGDKLNKTQISVLVNVREPTPYLRDCLLSLHRQSATNIEFCIVNSSTSSETDLVIDEFLSREPRAKVVEHCLQRKRSVEFASGQYVLFLDPNCYLNGSNALERLVKFTENTSFDIIQYPVQEFIGEPQRQVEKQRVVKDRILTDGISITKFLFSTLPTTGILSEKLFKTDVVRKAISLIPEGIEFHSIELFILLLSGSISSAYSYEKALKNISLHRLPLRTRNRSMSIDEFKTYVNDIEILSLVTKEFEKLGIKEPLDDVLKTLSQHVNQNVLNKLEEVPYRLKSSALLFLNKVSPSSEILCRLAEHYENREEEIVHALTGFNFPEAKERQDVKTIGVLYPRYFQGGVERVISLQLPLFQSMGYKVVLINEEIDIKKEYPLPGGVRRATIPVCYSQGRGEALIQICKKENIDILICHQTCFPKVAFDVLLVKSLGIKTVLYVHELTMQDLVLGWKSVPTCLVKPITFSYADKVLVLSEMEKTYYSQFGLSVSYVSNPIQDMERRSQYNPQNKNVLWIGRLDKTQKQYHDALEIFKIILSTIDGATCTIVGAEWTPGATEEIKKFVHENNLQGKIILCPATNNVEQYYEQASIVLCTSAFESFSMVIAESKVYSLPLVTYELPYLTLLKAKQGYISVPQGDVSGAAEEIIKILKNNELAIALSRQSRKSIQPFLGSGPQLKKWSEVFDELKQKHSLDDVNMNKKLWLETTLGFISSWHNKYSETLSAADQIKIDRYNKLYSLFTRFCPVNSLRRKYVLSTIKVILRLLGGNARTY